MATSSKSSFLLHLALQIEGERIQDSLHPYAYDYSPTRCSVYAP